MTISVVIVTCNRPKDVVTVLSSILGQSFLPGEVLLVDNCPQSTPDAALVEAVAALSRRGIEVLQFKSPVNSLPAARNSAIGRAKGDVVLFLDDDVVLDADYILEIVRVYEKMPQVMGVHGLINSDPGSPVREFLHRIFFWYHEEKGLARVLPSCSATYPSSPEALVLSEWLSGANHSYRREVFDHERYDDNLLKYADGEDLDMSYRVHLRFPGSLCLAPKAKLEHKTSSAGRAIGTELIFMREVYGAYLFFKLFPLSLRNCAIYLWSRVGRLLFAVVNIARHPSVQSLRELSDIGRAYLYCFMNLGLLRAGSVDFFNRTLSGVK